MLERTSNWWGRTSTKIARKDIRISHDSTDRSYCETARAKSRLTIVSKTANPPDETRGIISMLGKGQIATQTDLHSPQAKKIVTMSICRLNYVAVVLVCLTVGTAEGQSLGIWRLPSTPAQFFGFGYGPGRHAPMVRMPCHTPMSVQRLEIVHPQVGQGYCEVGCAGQPYYGGRSMVQPMQSWPTNTSQNLFSAPTKAITPMAPQPDPDEPRTGEPLPTPEN